MNQYDKEKIKELRKNGLGYKKISAKLNLNLNTVKSYCRNNHLTSKYIRTNIKCKNCKKEVKKIPKQKPRKFCCDKCRLSWWNLNRDKVKKTIKIEIVCSNCGRKFIAYDKENRKYCSLDCYYGMRWGS